MSQNIILVLLAASVPITGLALRYMTGLDQIKFVRLETEFRLFRDEVRRGLKEIKDKLEN